MLTKNGNSGKNAEWSLPHRVILSGGRSPKSNCEAAPKAGSTKNEAADPFCRSSKRGRFDFTKSAICRRFCKVRLLKHPTGMFYPLRMTRSISSCSIILYLLIRHGRAAPPSPQEKAFCVSSFAKRKWSLYSIFVFVNNKYSSSSCLSDAFDRAFSWGSEAARGEWMTPRCGVRARAWPSRSETRREQFAKRSWYG